MVHFILIPFINSLVTTPFRSFIRSPLITTVFKRHAFARFVLCPVLASRWILSYSCVRNVPESNAVNAASRLFIIFPVEAYFDIEKPSFLNILYPDIFKKNITDLVLVTAIHCHATLINRVILVMFQNVDVAESRNFLLLLP